MRPQVRPSEPEVLKANSQTWNDQWVKLKTGNPSASFSWYRIENPSARDLILPALREMNQRHCSFCDSFPLERQGEPIEHFRPKSDPRFLHLAYTWTNLYYCCHGCNGAKREQWNDDDRLISPDEFDYSFQRFFAFDFVGGRLLVNPVGNEADQRRATVTIDIFQLNQPALCRLRRDALEIWTNLPEVSRMLDRHPFRDFLNHEGV